VQSFSALHKLCVISHAGIILPKQRTEKKTKCNKRWTEEGKMFAISY